MKHPAKAGLIVLAAMAVVSSGTTFAATPSSCDAACLKNLVDSYFSALVAHDPSKVPIAPGARFVENITPMPVGSGLWKTATEAPTTFKLYVPDPVAQQVGFIGTMQEGGHLVEIGLRLKVDNGRITEMEHVIVRKIQGAKSLVNLTRPRPAFLAAVPVSQRSAREEMLKIGASYYEALTTGNGRAAPFADDCIRRENGMQTNGNPPPKTPGSATISAMGCAAQLDTNRMSYIKRIEPRRVWIADVQHGLVFGLSQFRHPQLERTVKIVGVPGVAEVKNDFAPFDMPAVHIWKIRGGRIHEIEALGFMAPYNSKTGWE